MKTRLALGIAALVSTTLLIASGAPAGAANNTIDFDGMTNAPKQILTVIGSGFTPGESVLLRECGDLVGGTEICKDGTVTTIVGTDGTFSVGLAVNVHFSTICGPGNCASHERIGRRYWSDCRHRLCDVQAISNDGLTGFTISWD